MNTDKISWLKLGAPDTGNPDVAAVFDRTKAAVGFVRNSQIAVAHKPNMLVAQEALSRSLMQDAESSLSQKERELIALVVSVENSCDACIFGHASKLRQITGNPVWVGEVEANYRHAELSARERTLADFAVRLTRTPGELGPADLDPLREQGLSETDILIAVGITAYFNLSNRINSAIGVKPNAEAYLAHR